MGNNPPQHQPPPPTSLTPAEHTALLEAFATSSMSLPQLAMLFNLTLADLAAWLAHPRTRADIEALRTLSAEREALTRALARPAAIAALEHTATQRDGASPETTRKAATTLLNLKPPTPAESPPATQDTTAETKRQHKRRALPTLSPWGRGQGEGSINNASAASRRIHNSLPRAPAEVAEQSEAGGGAQTPQYPDPPPHQPASPKRPGARTPATQPEATPRTHKFNR